MRAAHACTKLVRVQPLDPSDPERIASYELLGRLGAGGMGLVYKARSPGGRLVAVKVIRSRHTDDPDFLRRFRREVEAARSVSGFYTAPVVDADVTSGRAWLATAYVPGPSLDDAIRSRGPMSAREVTALAAALAEALKVIHAAGLVHRDFKPSNILLAEDGPRVIDFGIARAVDGTEMTGGLIGTPAYMAPEQIDGSEEIGPASDVFALGGVLYYAATGHPPFGTGDLRAVLYRVQTAKPDLASVPAELRGLIGRCLTKAPSPRPTPDEILAELAGSVGPVDWTGGTRTVQSDERTLTTDEPTAGVTPPPGPEPEPSPQPVPKTKLLDGPRPEPPPTTAPPVAATAPPQPADETLSGTPAWSRRRGWALLAITALTGAVAFAVSDLRHGDGFRPWSVGDVSGRPVLADGLAYIGAKDGVAAHDARTGERRWKSESGERETPVARHGAVLLVRSSTRLSAVDPRSGDRLWRIPLSADGCMVRPASPGRIMVINKVGGQDEMQVSAVEAATGNRVWSRTFGPISCSYGVAVTENGVAVVAEDKDDHALISLTAASGESWRVPIEETKAVTSDDSTIYAATRGKDGYRIRAYAADTGRRRWDAALPGPDGHPDLIAEGSRLHVLEGGALYAFQGSDGRRLWRSPLSKGLIGDFFIADGTVHVRSDDSYIRNRLIGIKTVQRNSLTAIDAATGRRLWHKQTEAKLSHAAAGGRTVYVASHKSRSFRPDDNALIAFDARTGRQRWKRGMSVGGAVTVGSGIVYVVNDDDELEAIDAATGDGP